MQSTLSESAIQPLNAAIEDDNGDVIVSSLDIGYIVQAFGCGGAHPSTSQVDVIVPAFQVIEHEAGMQALQLTDSGQ
ncbi:unnamed protein product [Mortierella alpina]